MTATPTRKKGAAKDILIRNMPAPTREFIHEYMDLHNVGSITQAVRDLLNEAHIRHLKEQHGL